MTATITNGDGTTQTKEIIVMVKALPPVSTPTSTPEPEPAPEAKTLEVIETPNGIKNPEKITVKPNGEAFNESVEVRLKDDPTVKDLIENSLTDILNEESENITVFPLDISRITSYNVCYTKLLRGKCKYQN